MIISEIVKQYMEPHCRSCLGLCHGAMKCHRMEEALRKADNTLMEESLEHARERDVVASQLTAARARLQEVCNYVR